jgi:enoyl-CoA hydratase/carnithine racemase
VTDYNTLLYEKLGTENRIARITLNRPEKMNSISQELMEELMAACTEAEFDSDVRVVVVRGAGRTFSAGYDLTPSGRTRVPYPSMQTDRRLISNMRYMLLKGAEYQLRFWNLSKVTIAQVHGYAIAGGCEWAMMADIVIAADDAKFGHPGTRGLGTPRNGYIWPLVIGMRKAKELMYTGDSISGVEAERIGMINAAVPADQLEAEVTRRAERIAIQAGDSLAIHKHMLNRFYENMGIYSSVRAAADFDATYQYTNQAYNWQDAVKESFGKGAGLKDALAWRDGPYADYRSGQKTEA